MQQQLWGYKVEEKIYLGVRERERLNVTGLDDNALGVNTMQVRSSAPTFRKDMLPPCVG